MPPNGNSEKSYSQHFAEKRVYLLNTLKRHLDESLVDYLNPQVDGVPFINFQNDPPQAVAIKTIINSFYYIEEVLKDWEKIDPTWHDNIKVALLLFKGGLYKIYKIIGTLDNATPEIREIITQNYHIIAPLYSQAYELVKQSGWIEQFTELDITEKSSKVIAEGISLLGSDVEKWNETNPLISSFEKISKLMNSVTTIQTEQDKKEHIETMRALLDDLDNNEFFNQLSIVDFENSKAIHDLLNWFKGIQEDGFSFTKNSIEQYILWANSYLPKLIMLADQLERRNYLKPGLLSKELCLNTDLIAQKMNELLDSDDTYHIPHRVISTDSFLRVREQHIELDQIESVRIIMAAEEQQKAVADFFRIMRAYEGKSFSEIIEPDRILLRKIYSKVQMSLAHANLEIENSLTKVLNTKGPEKNQKEPEGWWQRAITKTIEGVNYVTSFLSNEGVNKLLATENFIYEHIARSIYSEQFKITIAEKSSSNLQISQNDQLSLKERVSTKINAIKSHLKEQVPSKKVTPKQFIPVNTSELTNVRGSLVALQKMQLSVKVKEIQDLISTLVTRHIAKEEDNSLSTPHVIIGEDSTVHEHIKKIQDNLLRLEKALACFESLDFKFGLTLSVKQYIEVAAAANELRKCVVFLDPDSQKILAPILKQIIELGSTLSNKNYKSMDMSGLEHLKNLKFPIKEQPSQPKTMPVEIEEQQDKEQQDNLVIETSKSSSVLDFVKKIASARNLLLSRIKSTLSLPISMSLEPQEHGTPFINIEEDAPQIAAIKKMINSLYHAEKAINIWQDIDTSTPFGKVAAVHQGVAALSQVYKSFQFFTEVTPEVQNLIRENYDLIQPVIEGANKLINEEGWGRQFNKLELTKKVGSIIGQIVGAVQAPPKETTQTASLIKFLSEVPFLLNNMTHLVGSDVEVPINKLRISQERIDAISSALELLLEEHPSFVNIFKVPQAIVGLIDLNKKFQREATNLQESTIKAYQQWLHDLYPSLLVFLDEIETRYYLKPGTLSNSISLEVDKINDKLNEVIESKPPQSKLKKINLSSDLALIRKTNLDIKKVEYWNESFGYEEQQESAQVFFSILRKYLGKSFLDITLEDRVVLRQNFARIQLALANSNLDLTNECVIALNQLETRSPEQWVGVKVSIEQVLQQETLVQSYLTQRRKAALLKIKVIDQAIEHIKFIAQGSVAFTLEEPSIDLLHQNYLLTQTNKTLVGPGELKPIVSSSLYNVRGNLSFLQELKISSLVGDLRKKYMQVSRDKFSRLIQEYLNRPEGEQLHVINKNDPIIVRQIKGIENGFYHLEEGLKQFESISKNDKLTVQARALIEIKYEAEQLKEILEHLIPELKSHYGPLASKTLEFINKIRAIEYNKEDLQDLGTVLQGVKKELLKRKKPRTIPIERAFFDSNNPKIIPPTPNESVTTKAVRLGVKYLHLISPTMEASIKYLRNRYPNSFGKQLPVIRNYTRQQLSDEQWMRGEIKRLTTDLQEHYGFNLTTLKAIIDVVNQVQRAGVQISEGAGMVNQLITNDYVSIKENAYKDLIAQLSREEDYLCLKPGTLIHPAMSVINQFFLSVALELDMPFNKKLAILDEQLFINTVIAKTKLDLEDLKSTQAREPDNMEIPFQIKIKEDKLVFLQEQIELLADKKIGATKSALLDAQFEVYLRDLLKNSQIKKPIIKEYEKIAIEHYLSNKNSILLASDCGNALYESLQNFEKDKVGNYLIVSEAYRMLHRFAAKLPSKNQELKDYIYLINKDLANKNHSIEERALRVQSLPNDNEFLRHLSAADEGTHFLMKFVQFIKRVTSSIFESLATGKSIITLYNQKNVEDLMKNIEKTLGATPEIAIEDDLVEVEDVKDEETEMLLNVGPEEISVLEDSENQNICDDEEEDQDEHEGGIRFPPR